MEFPRQETNEQVKAKVRPIVIITSNNEKELSVLSYAAVFPLHRLPQQSRNAANYRCYTPALRLI